MIDTRYLPPEMLDRPGSLEDLEKELNLAKVDIYSLGASLFEVVTGKSGDFL